MITITLIAAKNLRELIAEENKGIEIPQTAGLRLYVQGGGCSGFQYGLMIEKEPTENDNVFESNGIKIFIDPISINYVRGAEVDFIEESGGFTIKKNPNATSTCGCGQSFNTE
jgi:iron-sulfur cluster assembly accessory protein